MFVIRSSKKILGEEKMKEKLKTISELQVVLTVVYVCALLISNVITSRQIQLPFGYTMTGGVIAFPITYILSDVFSECYGYKWSRKTCYMAFAMNVFMSLVFMIVINCPSPVWYENAEAYTTVLSSAPRVLIASFTAFVAGDFVNDKVFAKMKEKHSGMQGFGARAILSSFLGECVDSLIFIPIAFLGTMTIPTLVSMGVLQVTLKVGYEIIILPITRMIVKKVNQYEC